nr:hypothetical protein [Clostridia bacterium]
MSKKSILALLLAALMLLPACSGTGDNSSDDTDDIDAAAETTTEETAPQTTDIVDTYVEVEAVDYEGREFHFWHNDDAWEPHIGINAPEVNGEVLNDAVFYRNQAVEEKYNIDVTWRSYPGMFNTIVNNVFAGDAGFDVALELPMNMMSCAVSGVLLNMNEIPHLNFEMPWWNSTVLEDTNIHGFNYFAISSQNISAYSGTPVIAFNKQVAKDFGTDNFYEVMNNGDWTIDYIIEVSKDIISDVDGNGEYDFNDMYGFISNNFMVDCMIGGSGYKMVAKGSDGELGANYLTERMYDIIDKITSVTLLENGAYLTDRYHGAHLDNKIEIVFEDDRALFWVTNLFGVQRRRKMEGDFGLLPMPKIDEVQDKYYAHFQAGAGDAINVPITCDDTDMMGRILEDFAFISYKDVIPAFYDITLKGKAVRDEESSATLDLILDNYHYDIGIMLYIVSDQRELVTKNSDAVISWFESRSGMYNNKIEAINEAFK